MPMTNQTLEMNPPTEPSAEKTAGAGCESDPPAAKCFSEKANLPGSENAGRVYAYPW